MKSKQKWNASLVPDQTGRIAVVTGSSSGIGFETARVLTEKNAKVILAVRNQKKGDAAAEKIKSARPDADVSVMILDLANLKSVEAFSDAFKTKYNRLDLLINNAGVMMPPYSKTADGFELQFGTNHLGHFTLTGLLLDLILKTDESRIVNVSSNAHRWGDINFDDLNFEKKYDKAKAYGQSKIANLYFTYELQRKLDKIGKSTLALAAHPGWTATNLQQHSGLFHTLNPFFAQGPDMGALPTLYAATASDVEGGGYYGPGGIGEWRGSPKKVKSNAVSHDETIAGRLWKLSEEWTKVEFNALASVK